MTSAFNTKYSTLKQLISKSQYDLLKLYERLSLKILKLNLDYKFLIKCKTNEKIPNFIKQNFRHYEFNTLHIQTQLLSKEILKKKKLLFNLNLKERLLKNKLFQYFNLNAKLNIYQN